jgi:hypothetical protein
LTEIIVGWKSIENRLQVTKGTIKKWINDRGFPVLIEPGCQPILSMAAVVSWEEKRRTAIKKPGG